MKVDINTKKLYYGFPVILIGYKDEKWKYNVTTSSSSYTLGNMLVVGITKSSNCAKQILKNNEFTVNIPTRQMLNKVELCGFHSGINKIGLADLTYDVGEYVDAPVFDECSLSLECVVNTYVEDGDYINFITTIKRRAVEPEMLDEKGNFESKKLDPIYFLGDSNKRIFRYFNTEKTDNLGDSVDCCPNDSACG